MSHTRSFSLSEFLHFLFRAQLVDHNAIQIEKESPELSGQTGMQLKTFKESSTPVDDQFDDYQYQYQDQDQDHFLGDSTYTNFNGGFVEGTRTHGHRSEHARRASSMFDTSRFSTSTDRTSFVSSPTSTTPSSPTMSSASSRHGWRLYGGPSRPSIVSSTRPFALAPFAPLLRSLPMHTC